MAQQLPLFDESQLGEDGYRELALEGMPHWEKFYTRQAIDALVRALTAPVRVGPVSVRICDEQDRHLDVQMERLIQMMKISRRHREKTAAVKEAGGDVHSVLYALSTGQDAYRRLGHEWKEIGETFTNWEVCFLMMDTSLQAPLPWDAVEEYKRAFAHCVGIETYMECFEDEPLRLRKCEEFRRRPGVDRFPPLDDTERAWIEEFNERLKEPDLADQFFAGAAVKVTVGTERA